MESGSAPGSACDGDEGVSAAIGGSLETVRGAVKQGRRLLGLPFRRVIIGADPGSGMAVASVAIIPPRYVGVAPCPPVADCMKDARYRR